MPLTAAQAFVASSNSFGNETFAERLQRRSLSVLRKFGARPWRLTIYIDCDMSQQSDVIVKQIDSVLAKHREMRRKSEDDDCSDQPESETTSLMTLMAAAVRRFSPPQSEYLIELNDLMKLAGVGNTYAMPHLAGILGALRTAYEEGLLSTASELMHADIFADFLEMADHLLSEGYKDAAAVIAGSVLEEHLRQLCTKHSISAAAAGKNKKADLMNAELAGGSAYSKLDQKSVTAWLDLRNKAAHGQYGEYSKDQVVLLIQGIREFMARNPA
jgi:hypothetical protein